MHRIVELEVIGSKKVARDMLDAEEEENKGNLSTFLVLF